MLKDLEMSNTQQKELINVSTLLFIEEYNYQYYEEYKRLYQTAYYLSLQMKQLA